MWLQLVGSCCARLIKLGLYIITMADFEVSFTSDTESDEESDQELNIKEKKGKETAEAKGKAAENETTSSATVILNGGDDLSTEASFTISLNQGSANGVDGSSDVNETIEVCIAETITETSSSVSSSAAVKEIEISEEKSSKKALVNGNGSGTETIEEEKSSEITAAVKSKDSETGSTTKFKKEEGIDSQAHTELKKSDERSETRASMSENQVAAGDQRNDEIADNATDKKDGSQLTTEVKISETISASKELDIEQDKANENMLPANLDQNNRPAEHGSTGAEVIVNIDGNKNEQMEVKATIKAEEFSASAGQTQENLPEDGAARKEKKKDKIKINMEGEKGSENEDKKGHTLELEASGRTEVDRTPGEFVAGQAEVMEYKKEEMESKSASKSQFMEYKSSRSAEREEKHTESGYKSKHGKVEEESTEDLIKRILAEAGSDIKLSSATRDRYKVSVEQDSALCDEVPPEVLGAPGHAPENEEINSPIRRGRELAREPVKEPSLLERRLASLERDQTETRGATSKSSSSRMSKHEEEEMQHREEVSHTRSTVDCTTQDGVESSGAATRQSRQQRAGMMLQKQQHITSEQEMYDQQGAYAGGAGYSDRSAFGVSDMYGARLARHGHDEDDEDDSYRRVRRRQLEEEVLPDEEFIPTKRSDTDQVVQERTEDIRQVVENQDVVLKRLKCASDSFDELDSEIRAIREQFIESQMRRSMLLDDLEYEKMYVEQLEREEETGGQARRPPQVTRGATAAAAIDYDDEGYGYDDTAMDYTTKRSQYKGVRKYGGGLYRPGDVTSGVDTDMYSSPSSILRKQTALDESRFKIDKDLEADVLTRGSLSGLALRGDTQRSKTAYIDDMGTSRRHYGDRTSRFDLDDDYSFAGKKRGRSSSLFESDDLGFDTDYSARPSYRSAIQRKRAGGFVSSQTEDDDVAPRSSYRTPNLPSYRRFDGSGSSMESNAYTSSSRYSSIGRSGATTAADLDSYETESTGSSATGSRASRLARAKTVDYGSSGTSAFRSPAMGSRYGASSSATHSSFSSRFLNKVREKKATGEDVKTDKSFSSRFLGRSFDSPNPAFSARNARANKEQNSSETGSSKE